MDSETIERLLTYSFAAIVVLSGCGFVAFRQPVHSALSFASAVLASAGLYLLQDASYVAAAMVAVYAGATIIIFLFALMFAQRSRLQAYDQNLYNPWRSLFASGGLACIIIYAIGTRVDSQFLQPSVPAIAAGPADPLSVVPAAAGVARDPIEAMAVRRSSVRVVDLGREMYTRYLWAIEIAGTLLLVATVGAILMAERDAVSKSAAGGKVR